MTERPIPTSAVPQISIVIATYNDWEMLDGCLQSLAAQTDCPSFEVIVVDDGSDLEAPQLIRQWGWRVTLSILRQPHAGIPTTRNRGVRESKGQVLVFTDADCRFDAHCLSALNSALNEYPQHNCFQLHLAGDSSNLLGRAEDLRLAALQNHLLQPDGRIQYLNTAGFAIRRSGVGFGEDLFDPVALRGEDTLLLVSLMQQREIPVFLRQAMVHHAVRLSLSQCFRKDVKTAWLEAKTFELIPEKGVWTRMGNRERLRMLRVMWRTSRQPSIGHAAWAVVVARQVIQRLTSALHRLLKGSTKRQTSDASIA